MQIKSNKFTLAIFVGVMILFLVAGLHANVDPNAPARPFIAKPNAVNKITKSLSNIGKWSYPIWATGTSGLSFNGSDPGGIYPRGTAALIFTDGLVWGGYVAGDTLPKVGGVTYREGVQQGWIETPGTATTAPVYSDPNSDRAVMYRIRMDYQTLKLDDVAQDAAEMNMVDLENVTDQMKQDILDQYAHDYENWPVDLGAPFYDDNNNGVYEPELGEKPGIAGADQVVWCSYNDAASNTLYGSDPIGIELYATTWAYNQPSATLGQLVFRKYTFVNKSGKDIDSMFVCQWSDPDVGNYTDDFVGNDTSRSLGYAYTSALTDPDYSAYGLPPASVGYDFFQGPLVDGKAGFDLNRNGVDDAVDYGIFNLKEIGPGKINLPMTSFFYFASGSNISDPPLGDFDGTLEFYNMLNGYTPTTDLTSPTPYLVGSGDFTGESTKFPLSGDVVSQQGDVDGQGTNLAPGDRRMGMCSGPFKMKNGDTQEVVVAIIGGIVAQQGGDNRNAVVQMQLNSDFAQFVYDNLFQAIPRAPEKPTVNLTPGEDHIVIEWGSDLAKVAATETDDPILGFNFEGYNVYQLPSAAATIEQATKIATYDKANGITSIYGTKFVGSIGDIVTIPIQKGSDSGIKRSFVVDRDYITGTQLYPGATYYFAVTAYNYNSDPSVPEPSLESSAEALVVVAQGTVPGTKYSASAGEALAVAKTGNSTGAVAAEVVNPATLITASYKVGFYPEEQYTTDAAGDTVGVWHEWYAVNTANGDTLVKNNSNLTGDNDYPIFNGVIARVSGPKSAGLAGWDYDGGRWYSGVNWGAQEFFGGLDIGANFFGSTLGTGDLVPILMEFQDQADVDANGYISKGALYRRDQGYAYAGIGELPFACYDVSDPANPRRVNICFVESDGADGAVANAIWDMGWDGSAFPGELGAREYIFMMKSDYSEGAGYDDTNFGPESDVLYAIWPKNRGSAGYLSAKFTMSIFANLPNTPADSYGFSTTAPTSDDAALAAADVEKVNVFPNPYYASNAAEPDRFTRFVTFNHLPKTATIRIFNLAGIQVRKIEKDSPGQFLKWNLQNENNIPVASGMYIAHIDMGSLGEKVLKIMIIQAQEVLKYY